MLVRGCESLWSTPRLDGSTISLDERLVRDLIGGPPSGAYTVSPYSLGVVSRQKCTMKRRLSQQLAGTGSIYTLQLEPLKGSLGIALIDCTRGESTFAKSGPTLMPNQRGFKDREDISNSSVSLSLLYLLGRGDGRCWKRRGRMQLRQDGEEGTGMFPRIWNDLTHSVGMTAVLSSFLLF